MINFAVINLKSTIKILLKIIIVLLLIIGIVDLSDLIKNFNISFSYVNLIKSNINYNFNSDTDDDNSIEKIIFTQEMPILAASNNIESDIDYEVTEESSSENISETELASTDNDETEETSVVSNENSDLRNLTTEVISENNISESYNTLYGDVKIKNETSFELTQDILTPDVEFTNKSDIVIFHTHTCESYTPTEENTYVASRQLPNN